MIDLSSCCSSCVWLYDCLKTCFSYYDSQPVHITLIYRFHGYLYSILDSQHDTAQRLLCLAISTLFFSVHTQLHLAEHQVALLVVVDYMIGGYYGS